MGGGRAQHRRQVGAVGIYRPGDERGFGAEGEGKIVPQVYYLVRFWHSAKTKSQGSRQQDFSDPVSGQNSFYLPNPVGHTNEELLAECQAHFLATYTEAAE